MERLSPLGTPLAVSAAMSARHIECLWGMKWYSHCGIAWQLPKKQSLSSPSPSYHLPQHLPKKKEETCPPRDLHKNVLFFFFFPNLKLE